MLRNEHQKDYSSSVQESRWALVAVDPMGSESSGHNRMNNGHKWVVYLEEIERRGSEHAANSEI